MPGPKMGPRPADFDEDIIRQSPTFIRWNQLKIGEKLRYACRDFVKGHGDDEERLMRRVMIARRNNLKDHQALKRARVVVNVLKQGSGDGDGDNDAASGTAGTTTTTTATTNQQQAKLEDTTTTTTTTEDNDGVQQPPRKRRPSTMFSDTEVAKEMDVPAVEATRSYRSWIDLPNGAEFIYNQKYIKGREGHDWLLRKNIWRRMRYRRENKRMVERMRTLTHPINSIVINNATSNNTNIAVDTSSSGADNLDPQHMMTASQIVDETLLAGTNPTPPGTTATKRSNHSTAAARQSQTKGDDTTATSNNSNNDTTTASVDVDDEYANAVEAAVAVAASYVKSPYNVVHNPLEAAANTAALDAAARLAAASTGGVDDDAAAAAAAAITAGGNNNDATTAVSSTGETNTKTESSKNNDTIVTATI